MNTLLLTTFIVAPTPTTRTRTGSKIYTGLTLFMRSVGSLTASSVATILIHTSVPRFVVE